MWYLIAALVLAVVTQGQELNLEETCVGPFNIAGVNIPETCVEFTVDVCEEEISVLVTVDGEVLLDESMDDFEDAEACYPLDDNCEVCVRPSEEVEISPTHVYACLESFSRCNVGISLEFGQADLGCIDQGNECEDQTTCGTCIQAECGWCGGSCVPIFYDMEEDEVDVFCGFCEEELITTCPGGSSLWEDGVDPDAVDTDLDPNQGGNSSDGYLVLVVVLGVALVVVLFILGCVCYRRRNNSRLLKAHHRVQASDNLDMPDTIDLDDDDNDDLLGASHYAPPAP